MPSLIFRACAAIATLISTPTAALAIGAPPIETAATHALIMDYETGEILFEKDADTPTAPASMSKLMTVAIVLEKLKANELSLEDDFDVSVKAWRTGGSKMWVREGAKIKLRNLLRGAIIQSGNDACIVIAENIAGSEDAFVDLMNLKAREWGLEDSTFANATGWPHPDHKMSMRDLGALARMIIKEHQDHYGIFSESEFTWEKIRQPNRNPLLGEFVGADGLKTGHTDESGYGVVGSAAREGVRRIIVVNGLEDQRARARESLRLMVMAFNDFRKRTLYKAGDVVGAAEVFGGETAQVPLLVREDVELILHRTALNDVVARVVYEGPLVAPVQKGRQAGYLRLKVGDASRDYPVFVAEDAVELGVVGKIILGARKLLLKPEPADGPVAGGGADAAQQ
ncbi:MAG: D-alanyl-D-alanine carboxypeptidase family protein [Pseudomonadota bacterium]